MAGRCETLVHKINHFLERLFEFVYLRMPCSSRPKARSSALRVLSLELQGSSQDCQLTFELFNDYVIANTAFGFSVIAYNKLQCVHLCNLVHKDAQNIHEFEKNNFQ